MWFDMSDCEVIWAHSVSAPVPASIQASLLCIPLTDQRLTRHTLEGKYQDTFRCLPFSRGTYRSGSLNCQHCSPSFASPKSHLGKSADWRCRCQLACCFDYRNPVAAILIAWHGSRASWDPLEERLVELARGLGPGLGSLLYSGLLCATMCHKFMILVKMLAVSAVNGSRSGTICGYVGRDRTPLLQHSSDPASPPLSLSELVIAAVTLCCLCFWCALHDTESYMQAKEDAI